MGPALIVGTDAQSKRNSLYLIEDSLNGWEKGEFGQDLTLRLANKGEALRVPVFGQGLLDCFAACFQVGHVDYDERARVDKVVDVGAALVKAQLLTDDWLPNLFGGIVVLNVVFGDEVVLVLGHFDLLAVKGERAEPGERVVVGAAKDVEGVNAV